MKRTTIASLSQQIVTEADAYKYLEGLRWQGCPECAHCGSADVRLIPPANGVSRKTANGTMSERRVWKCARCRKQFSVLTNTVMHATKIPVRVWVLVFFEMASSKNGVAAREIERKYGVTMKTAWHLLHRIRQAMGADHGPKFTGDVVADETYIGGDPANRHASQRGVVKRGRGTSKAPVVTVIESATGRARSRAVPDVTGRTLRSAIMDNVDMAFSTLHTDALPAYLKIGAQMAGHFYVDHSTGEYTTEKSKGTNQAENFFSQLKRSLDGTHHHVSREHLHRYLGEFDFRYSTCRLEDSERMRVLVSQIEGRLSLEDLTTA